VEPGWASALAGRRVARVANARGVTDVRFVASKVDGKGDVRLVERLLGKRVYGSVPHDEAVAAAEREGAALLDMAPESPVVAAIERLADLLVARTLPEEVTVR
jgi:CO dehydrogenase nickel-insertion accessory protein CooC1